MAGAGIIKRITALESVLAPAPAYEVIRTFWSPSPEGPRWTGLLHRTEGRKWQSETYPDYEGALVLPDLGEANLRVIIHKPEGTEA